MDICRMTVHELSELLQHRIISSTELTRAFIERIHRINPVIKGYITICEQEALRMAEDADKRLATGIDITPLTGVPIAIKDNMCTQGIKTTCASKILHNFFPPYDATVVSNLRQAGAVFLGKSNLDEFAMGSSTENSSIALTCNPWDLERVPGGSSGGSAAVVAADMAASALGSDTGGSIRQPAAFCGIVGFKPTYGRVSRYGLIAFASSLDQIGPMTKDIHDAALLLNVISGKDPLDSTSADIQAPDFVQYLNDDIKGMRIGVPKEYFIEGIDASVMHAIHEAIKHFEALGAIIIDVSLPHTKYAVATYYLCATAEASSNLARYDGVHYGFRAGGTNNIIDLYSQTRSQGFGDEVKRRIMLGTYALSAGYYDAYYLKSLKVRTLIKQDFEKAFEHCDVILTPTTPTAAFKFGEKTADPLTMYLSDIFTISANLAGTPGVSLNCGFTSTDLPIGMQLLAPIFKDERLIQAGYAFQQKTNFHTRKPVETK